MNFTASACLALIGCFALNRSGQAAVDNIEANRVAEISFQAEKSRGNPFLEIELDVVFTDPEGMQKTVPAFWAGGDDWKVRYASPILGAHSYRTQCSDTRDKGLHGIEGRVEIKSYYGENALYRRGPIQVSPYGRYFEHADGTPFFWLGDTWWKGLVMRLPWKGFKELTADRKAKGFNVVQIVCGPVPDEPDHDTRLENEGGMPYDKSYTHINPKFFDYADRRIEHLIDEEILPVIFGAWGYHMKTMGAVKLNRHWRYLIARYGAYPVVLSIAGESFKGDARWNDVAKYVRSADPYRRLATVHARWSRNNVTDETLIDFDMLLTGHGSAFQSKGPIGQWTFAAQRAVSTVMAAYSMTPPMPVVNGEAVYEGHMMTNYPDAQRQVFWSCFLSGMRGYTYGAEGLWQMNSETVRGAEYSFTPWNEAMHFPGSTQLGQAKKFLEAYPWWRMEPHLEWVDPHCTSVFETNKNWSDAMEPLREFQARGGRWDLPYAAGIPGELRIIYIPGHYYDWTAPTIKGLEPEVPYHAFLFDPARAKRYELGLVVNISKSEVSADQMKQFKKLYASVDKGQPLVMHENPYILSEVDVPEFHLLKDGNFTLERLPAPQDWVMVLERVGK
ncbi:MAG: DUF4038 domain-containing protein [Opitutae bacterium]|nr:DUF4038 domain-containing protein [Opitutae bacterium]